MDVMALRLILIQYVCLFTLHAVPDRLFIVLSHVWNCGCKISSYSFNASIQCFEICWTIFELLGCGDFSWLDFFLGLWGLHDLLLASWTCIFKGWFLNMYFQRMISELNRWPPFVWIFSFRSVFFESRMWINPSCRVVVMVVLCVTILDWLLIFSCRSDGPESLYQ